MTLKTHKLHFDFVSHHQYMFRFTCIHMLFLISNLPSKIRRKSFNFIWEEKRHMVMFHVVLLYLEISLFWLYVWKCFTRNTILGWPLSSIILIIPLSSIFVLVLFLSRIEAWTTHFHTSSTTGLHIQPLSSFCILKSLSLLCQYHYK